MSRLSDLWSVAVRWPSPLDLAQDLLPGYQVTEPLRRISRELVTTLRQGRRLTVSMPPQEGKSTLLRVTLLWWLLAHPYHRIAIVSYSITIARTHALWIRTMLESHDLGIRPRYGDSRQTDWKVDRWDGEVRAVGVGGSLTGNAADVLVVDDPVKDMQQADSSLYRSTLWDWWQSVAQTRLAPGASSVVVQTRWHKQDLAGRLIEAGWPELTIPARDPDTGAWMESARKGRDWQQVYDRTDPRVWSALYQGRPVDDRTAVFHDNWWQPVSVVRHTDRIIQSWDLSFGNEGDYTVGQVWAIVGNDAHLLDQVRGKWTFTEQVNKITALKRKWPNTQGVYVERAANGAAVIDYLAQTIPDLVPVIPRGSKIVRASAVTPYCRAGHVHLPEIPELREELAEFPAGAHDDQVDALTQALTQLYVQNRQMSINVLG